MKRKVTILPSVLLILSLGFFVMTRIGVIYTSHAAVVDDTIESLLANRDLHLPQQTADLSMITLNTPAVATAKAAIWRTDNTRLENTRPIVVSLLDDDPIYRLKADLHVVYEDGTESIVSWESWRYGLVLGPLVVSLGHGPPGYITSVASIDDVWP